MIDTKKTYDELLELEFSEKQANGLTRILHEHDTVALGNIDTRLTKVGEKLDHVEIRVTRVEAKLDLLLWMWPIGIGLIGIGLTILGWLITVKKVGP